MPLQVQARLKWKDEVAHMVALIAMVLKLGSPEARLTSSLESAPLLRLSSRAQTGRFSGGDHVTAGNCALTGRG